jgi:hypothetical protein
MSKNQDPKSKPETFEHLHNKKLTTRREFLGAGLIPFAAAYSLPTWIQLFAAAGEAQAQELICQTAGAGDLCPFIGLKLSTMLRYLQARSMSRT